jgi:ABC-2 type transport system permease protein
VDRLIALVVLRWRMDLRGLFGARERLLGLVLLVPTLVLGSLAASAITFFGVLALARAEPDWVLPLVSAVTTLVGVLWALSPLLAGVAFSETHDLGRLVHFPVPFRTLLLSSLLANLAEPLVLAKLPLLLALAAALAGAAPLSFPLAVAGVALTFTFILVATQVAGLVFLALARNRRAQDRAMFLGLGLGFLLSLLPVFFMVGGGRAGRGLLRFVVERDVFVLSPFAWGARAAVHVGRGELGPFGLFLAAALLAVVVAVGFSSILAGRIYQGELDLGQKVNGKAPAARMRLSGPLGALVEKDLRVTWRDPRLKALIFTGLLGPVVLIFFLLRGASGRPYPPAFFMLASILGLGVFGANALGMERRGLLLLLGFPFPRWQILVAKNAGAAILRLPGILLLLVATAFLLSPVFAVPVLTIVLATLLLAAGADNFISVLFPIAVPAPGRNPYGPVSGGRGLGAGVIAALLLFGAMTLSGPFAFLAWLPWLLETPWLWLATLPMALAGAAAVYAMMVAAAARLLTRREPEVLARVLGEE